MSDESTPLISNKVYNVLKPITTVVLPGISTLYFTLAQIWGFPAAEQVVGTIAALNVFLGAFVQLSSRSYNRSDAKYDGVINVVHMDGGGKSYDLVMHGDPSDLDQKDQAIFKIN